MVKFSFVLTNCIFLSAIAASLCGVTGIALLATIGFWFYTICSPIVFFGGVALIVSKTVRQETHAATVGKGYFHAVLDVLVAIAGMYIFAWAGWLWLTITYVVWTIGLILMWGQEPPPDNVELKFA